MFHVVFNMPGPLDPAHSKSLGPLCAMGGKEKSQAYAKTHQCKFYWLQPEGPVTLYAQRTDAAHHFAILTSSHQMRICV